MKTTEIPIPPYNIIYHEDWSELINEIKKHYIKIYEHIKNDINPSEKNIFKFLQNSLNDKEVCLVGRDPYPTGATGVAFEDPNFRKVSIRRIANKIQFELGLTKQYSNYNFNKVDGVIALNYTPTCKNGITGSHEIFWEPLSINILNFIAKKIKIFLFFGKGKFGKISNIFKTTPMIFVSNHPSDFSQSFMKSSEVPFTILNAVLDLQEKTPINWKDGFELLDY